MTQRQYRAAAQWFAAHPAAKALLRVVSKGSVALVYAAYLGLLGWLGWHRDRKSRRVGKECRSRWSPYH